MGAKHDRKLVDDIAREMIERHKVTLEWDPQEFRMVVFVSGVCRDAGFTAPDVLYRVVADMVWAKVKPLKRATIGRIAATGHAKFEPGAPNPTSLYQAAGKPYLSTRESGLDLIIRIATIAIVAHMWDILDEEFRARQERDRQARVERLVV